MCPESCISEKKLEVEVEGGGIKKMLRSKEGQQIS